MNDSNPTLVTERPYYRSVGRELDIFAAAAGQKLPVLLKGPTGCGKSRMVEAMAYQLERPLITVSCNEDTGAADLLGRWIVRGAETIWQDGPATRAARIGGLLYLDEVAEAREDVLVALHALSDHRRELYLDRCGQTVHAHPQFLLAASYNPGYRRGSKDLKPSTRQRFIAISMHYPDASAEAEIVVKESGCEASIARQLVAFAQKIRVGSQVGLMETASTRLLVAAARLVLGGIGPRHAVRAAIVEALTDDVDTLRALGDLTDLSF